MLHISDEKVPIIRDFSKLENSTLKIEKPKPCLACSKETTLAFDPYSKSVQSTLHGILLEHYKWEEKEVDGKEVIASLPVNRTIYCCSIECLRKAAEPFLSDLLDSIIDKK
jgi:hypothetical protein